MSKGQENSRKTGQKLQKEVQRGQLGQIQSKESKIFYLEDQKNKISQLFTFYTEHHQNQQDLFFNFYELFAKIEDSEHKFFTVFNQKQCKFQMIRKIIINHERKTCQIDDLDFWDIVRETSGLVTIKYTDYQPLNLSQDQNLLKQAHKRDQNENQIAKEDTQKSVQTKITKGGRSCERTIGEIILLVKKWRQNKKIGPSQKSLCRKTNLFESAKEIGISKKSLDDYYFQLRNGEKFGFDFKAHLDRKVGFLRSFLRNKIPKKFPGNRNKKHGKQLKILREFNQFESPFISLVDNNESITQTKSQQPHEISLIQESGIDFLEYSEESYMIQGMSIPFQTLDDNDFFMCE